MKILLCISDGASEEVVLIQRINGQIAFGCKLCSRSYIHKRDLTRHLRYECGKEPQFKCDFCPYMAKLRKTVRKHMLVMHLYKIGTSNKNC